MRRLIFIFLLVAGSQGQASSQPLIIVNHPIISPRGLVVIAPAKKYLMQERLFEGLAQNLSNKGFVVVRFNWRATTLSDPAFELQRAAEDIRKVVTGSQKHFNTGPHNTILISKSFSTKALGPSLQLVKSHILITPNCSPESPFADTYGNILNDKNINTSIFISNNDPNCDVKQIHQTLIQSINPPSIYLTHGDHNFVIQPPQAAEKNIYHYQYTVIQMISIQVLSDFYANR